MTKEERKIYDKERHRLAYIKNRESVLEKVKKYAKENPEKLQETKTKVRRSLYGRLSAIFNAQIQRSKKNAGHLRLHRVDYSKEYLINRFLNDDKYIQIHKEWVASNYDKKLTPSIDRINPKIHYTKENIQILTWQQNLDKARNERNHFKMI